MNFIICRFTIICFQLKRILLVDIKCFKFLFFNFIYICFESSNIFIFLILDLRHINVDHLTISQFWFHRILAYFKGAELQFFFI